MRVLQAKTKRPLDLLAVGAGGRVAAASSAFGVRGDVDVWEIATGKVRFTHTADERDVRGLAFTPDGQHLLASASRFVEFLDSTTGGKVAELKPDLTYPAFAVSADGTHLLTTESLNQAGEVECWAVNPDRSFRRLWHDGPHEFCWFNNPAMSPDGRQVAVAVNVGFRGDRTEHPVELRDAGTGKVQAQIKFAPADPPEQILFSADGSKLLARSSGRTVKVFSAATGEQVGELLHPGRPFVTGMAVHPDGTVACCRNNGAVCLWDLEKREIVRTLDWKLGKLVSVAFSPDGSVGAAGTEDGQVVVWDVDS